MEKQKPVPEPYALRVTFTKTLSPTTLAFLRRPPMKGDEALIKEWMQTFLHEAERFALDYVRDWIDDASVIPTVAVISKDGTILDTERIRVAPVDPRDRPVPQKSATGRLNPFQPPDWH